MENTTQSLEKWIFTRNSAWFYYSSTPFKIGIHLRTYTLIFKYKHTIARTNVLVGTKIYAVHIACIETDLSLMNVFHLFINDWKTWHPTKYDIFPFCSLQSSSCRNWNDLTHIFLLFRVLQMKTSSLLQLQLLYVFQTNNSFNMLSNWIKPFLYV